VSSQVEFLHDILQITFRLGARREMLRPTPFLQEFLREGVAVSFAFGIEPAPGISIPMPGPANVLRLFQDDEANSHLLKSVGLVYSADTGPNNYRVVDKVGMA
jgi:hypothetical protein